MTTPRAPKDLLSAYLADGIDVLPDRVVDAVLDEAHRTRQRVVLGPRRTPVMNSTLKVFLAAAAVIAVIVAGINFLPRNDTAVGGPTSAPPSTSLLPSPSPQVDRMGLGGTDQHFSVDLPEGWENGEWVADNQPLGGDTAFFVGLVDNTFDDPCEGPLPCSEFYWYQESPGAQWWAVAADERLLVWIFDVDGQRIVIGARSYPGTTDDAKADLQDILDTIVFDSPAQPSSSPAAS